MEIVNPITAYPIGLRVENINGVPMRGIPEKQGMAFSRHGRLQAQQAGGDADAIGAAVRRAMRPLSAPNLAKARAEYAAREVVKFPRYFIVEPTAVCNRKCPFCTIIVTNRKGMMKRAHFEKLMVECSKCEVYGLSLYQLGEPFLWHSIATTIDYVPAYAIYEEVEKRVDISYMVSYAKTIGGFRAVNLSTNGDVPNLDCILGSPLDDLIISIDGTTAEVYDANRPSTRPNDAGAFERTIDRVVEFLEKKAKGGEDRPWVRMQCINKENTAAQVVDFVRCWIDVPGVDDVLIKNLDGMGAWLNGVVSADEASIKMSKVRSMPCQHIYAIGSMVADGRYTACCHDALTELTTTDAHIDKMTFAEWWNGDYMNALRAEHEQGATRRPCVACAERDPWLGN